MKITAQQIFEKSNPADELVDLLGNKQSTMTNIAAFEDGGRNDMVFAPNRNALEIVLEKEVSIVVIPQKMASFLPVNLGKMAIILSHNIGISHARLKQKYGDHDYTQAGWKAIHPSAIIHETVILPKGTRIGPNVVIEKGVTLGTDCSIMANVVIEHQAKIGNNVTIHPGTIIGWDCEIGNDCLILSNSVIGGEGFGYAQDQYFNHYRIPQTGKVRIGHKVTIGALNTIDRGTYGATIIGNGCIFDNMCHVAHNVKLGENCIILSGFLCAGSSVLGNRVVASGGTMIKDHVNICDNTYLVHRAGVIDNITQSGMYAGSPVLPMQDYVKSNAIYRELGELRKMVVALTEKLAAKK